MKKSILMFLISILLIVVSGPVRADSLAETLSGQILLQVEENGEAWYVYPVDGMRYYLGRPDDAFDIMRNLGLGIKHSELENFLANVFPARLAGMILLDVEKNGEAYYIYPNDLKGYYLGRPADAFEIMRSLGLGITNNDLLKIISNTGRDTAKNKLNFALVDTGQTKCYDNTAQISCPKSGDFFGQDAQYESKQSNYSDNGDGTIMDNVTGLMWQQDPGEKKYYSDAVSGADGLGSAMRATKLL